MKDLKPYLIEFVIVTAGVLIALLLSNYKENLEARKYQDATMETINMEIQNNYSGLKGIVKKQTNLLDTLIKYTDAHNSIQDLFQKANGLQIATLGNAGLDFYKKGQINLIDFELMATLIQMNSLSDLVDTKVGKLIDFTYSKILDNSIESKTVVILHLRNVLNTENQLLGYYESYLNKNVEGKSNTR